MPIIISLNSHLKDVIKFLCFFMYSKHGVEKSLLEFLILDCYAGRTFILCDVKLYGQPIDSAAYISD